jgi:hypothetical protein
MAVDRVYIECIGVDNKQHVCLPESDKCKCGVAVQRKKPLRDDWKLFSCWECTY